MRLLIVSAATHFQYDSCLYGYGPYVLEIDMWADLFPEVVIAAPCRNAPPPDDYIAFERPNISVLPQKETGGHTLKAKILQLLALPMMVLGLLRAMRKADAIHVRCPGNLGLLGVLLAPLFSKYLVAKYAGQWCRYPAQPWSVPVQRALLRSRWWHGPVTVYGSWPNEPDHIVPFFTSIMTDEQMDRARDVARRRKVGDVLQVLYTGRLSVQKNVHILLAAMAKLKAEAIGLRCVIVGDGEYRASLEARAEELGLDAQVEFVGSMSFDRVLDFYEQSDVLVLASESEGWPKSITEGMAFGLVCVGSDRGLIPMLLEDGRGVVVPPGDTDALARVLREIASSPQDYQSMRASAAAWGQQYTLEGLREALRDLLSTRWGIPLDTSYQTSRARSEDLCETH